MVRQRGPWGQGQIEQLGPKSFRLRWSAGNDVFTGKRVRHTLTLRDVTATQARAELRAKLAHRTSPTRLTLGELIDTTIRQLDVTEGTRAGYMIALGHIPAGARAWRVNEITVTKAATLIDGLAERHGPQTVRKAVSALLSCWRQAYRNGWVRLEDNPWRAHKLPAVATGHADVLTDAEIAAIRAVAEVGMEQAWIEIHLATGARPGEVVALRRSDVDLDESVIRFVDAKHGGRPRFVAIGENSADVIASWFEMQAERAEGHLVADPYLLSMDVEGAVPWRAEYASKYRWHALAERANLRPRDVGVLPNGKTRPFKSELPLYALRHLHNSLLAAGGVSAATRGKRIGNTEALNASTYVHLVAREDREAAAIIDRRLTEASGR